MSEKFGQGKRLGQGIKNGSRSKKVKVKNRSRSQIGQGQKIDQGHMM